MSGRVAIDPVPPPAATGSGVLDRITLGALRYVLSCTAMDVGDGDRVLLTDHRLLPLSWTRDAYYQALLLLGAADRERRAGPTVAGHLRWLWGRGRDADRGWMRSHLPFGQPKDLALQADQQLYPLLELLDYRTATGHWPASPGPSWRELVTDAWQRLPRHGPDGLLAGQENPADDPSELPYALSTQILFWHTARRLAAYSDEVGLDHLRPAEAADRVRAATLRRFARPGPAGIQWAYEIDDAGNSRLYQDANDLPTAFAPLIGFCAADDPTWLATMRYAFSRHNPAYVPGRFGGLGSAHTPGTWTLGDAQELGFAAAVGDRVRAARVVARLNRVAGPDGLLPETYHPDTAGWLARHWFAWPAAVIGALHQGRIRPIT